MMRIRKAYNFKILCVSIGCLFYLGNTVYSQDYLRIPITGQRRIGEVIESEINKPENNLVYRQIEEAIKNKQKDRIVMTIEGNAGTGKNFISDFIKENGIYTFGKEEIGVIDLDNYLPEIVDDGFDTMIRDSDGTLFIPMGDIYLTRYMKYSSFVQDFELLSQKHSLLIVVGLYMPKFFQQIESFRPDIRVQLDTKADIGRMRVLRRDGYIKKYTDSLDVIEKMKSLALDIPVDLAIDNSVIFQGGALPFRKPNQTSFTRVKLYGKITKESAYLIKGENEFEALSAIIISEAKLAGLSYKIDSKSYELSDVEAVVAGTFSILRYLLSLGEEDNEITIRRYEKGIEVIVQSNTQQMPEPKDVANTLLRPAFSHCPEVIVVNRLNGYSRTFGSRWSNKWIPASGTLFALCYPSQIPDMQIGWITEEDGFFDVDSAGESVLTTTTDNLDVIEESLKNAGTSL